jgi:hypothetical protein
MAPPKKPEAPPEKPDYRWKSLHQLLLGAEYAEDYASPDAAAYWDRQKGEWVTPGKLNCITAVNFFLGYLLRKGGNGYEPGILDNLVNASARGKGFSNHFEDLGLAFFPGDTTTVKKLATSDSRYSGADRWPYWEMPFALTKSVTCKCGIHVSPKFVLDNKAALPRVSVASVSLCAGTPVGTLKRWLRSEATGLPFDGTTLKLRWEYTVMLLFNLSGKLFVYHHQGSAGDQDARWRTFERQARVWVDAAAAPRIQDSLWLIWGLPDKKWRAVNPNFFQDDDGTDWSPDK